MRCLFSLHTNLTYDLIFVPRFRAHRAVNVVGIADVIGYISAPVKIGFSLSPCYMTLAVDVWQDSAQDVLDYLVKQTNEACLRVIINVPDML